MREELLGILRCPVDLGRLRLNAGEQHLDGHVLTGHLQCDTCDQSYPISKGVPDLVPSDKLRIGDRQLNRLQVATVERFGFEWRYFHDWGWLTGYPDVPDAEERFYGGLAENTRLAFWSKSLFDPADLGPGLLVLDGGCGNGRFTNEAARSGATVVGIDLGWGVHSAFDHTRGLPNAHIVRADIFRLPFADNTFDRIFSIGVLMHTGSAGAAFDSLARPLRPGGMIVAHVYGKGMTTYEIVDAAIRAVTTHLPLRLQVAAARSAAAGTRWLRHGRRRGRFYRWLFRHILLLPTEHHMYDWWSAPIATHHNLDEVVGWFSRNGLEVLRTNPRRDDPAAELARQRAHGSITALGRRPKAGGS